MSLFSTTRILPAPPDAVFAAIQDPVRLARWWGPDGFRSTFHTFEFRPGGAWHFTMHGPDGTNYPNQSQFLEIEPTARIRIKHVNLPHFELCITLEHAAEGTILTWVSVFEDAVFAEQARAFLENANEQNLDRLSVEVCGLASSHS